MSTKKIQPFYDDGYAAFCVGLSMTDNPYIGVDIDKPDGWYWSHGFVDALAAVVRSLDRVGFSHE